ncbi:hypothetical protein LCGC14_0856900 [marine sediment metagenome]|uniref:Uncharacterized protein n=1 Tax=marine sediment metagenome TaxID=412755 RepID=A0A0F9PDF2_9ZZZZ
MIKRILLFFSKRSKLLKQIDRQARMISIYQYNSAAFQVKIHDLKTIIYLQEIAKL